MVDCLIRHPQATGVYCDEDTVSRSGGKATPLFKPAWTLPLVESAGFLSIASCCARPVCPTRSTFASWSRRRSPLRPRKPAIFCICPAFSCIARHAGCDAAVTSLQRLGGSIPTGHRDHPDRDPCRSAVACLEGLLERTDRGALDIIVIDNDSKGRRHPPSCSTGSRRWAMCGAWPCRRLQLFPRLQSRVAAARHERILLLNNDVEPLDRLWLGEMNAELDDPRSAQSGRCCSIRRLRAAWRRHLGAGSIARHSFHFHDLDGGKTRVAGTAATCVSGDGCMSLDRKSHWLAVSGMDEAKLPVASTTSIMCLKLRALDLDIVWTPHARLVHRESVSRGRDDSEEKRQRFAGEERVMFERWQAVIGNDPIYNPNCSLSAADFSLEAVPRDLSPAAPDYRKPHSMKKWWYPLALERLMLVRACAMAQRESHVGRSAPFWCFGRVPNPTFDYYLPVRLEAAVCRRIKCMISGASTPPASIRMAPLLSSAAMPRNRCWPGSKPC